MPEIFYRSAQSTMPPNDVRKPVAASAIRGLLAVALGLGASPARAANLLGNGDFETPAAPAGGFALFSTGQTIGAWTVVGAAGNVATVSTTFAQSGFTFPARSARQFLDLAGTSNTATGVSQSVATIPGRLYDLTFYVGNVVNAGASSARPAR
jgi:hypothetical protein